MTPFSVVVDLHDAARSGEILDDGSYAGETRLFVLAAESLSAALTRLLGSVEAKGCTMLQLHSATPAEEFDGERFTFGSDLPAMMRDALDLGEICASPDYPFTDYAAPKRGAFWGLFDLFDPATGQGGLPYAGEFRWAAVWGETAGDALRRVLGDLALRNCVVKSVDDLAHVVFYDPETQVDGRPLDAVALSLAKSPGVVWAEGASLYGSDTDT